MNRYYRYIWITILCCLLNACDDGSNSRTINLTKSEEIIKFIDSLDVNRVVLNDQNLIIDDTLVLMNPKSLKRKYFHKHKMSLEEWTQERVLPDTILVNLLELMEESSNKVIVKEKNAYFFNEGGWVDSDFGKVYSEQLIEGKAAEFKFDRVQEIKVFEGRKNWYTYYAD